MLLRYQYLLTCLNIVNVFQSAINQGSWTLQSIEIGKRPERLKAKGEEEHRMRWLCSIMDSMDINLSNLPETVKDRGAWHAAVHRLVKSRTRLRD